MIYFCDGVLAVSIGVIIIFSRYRADTLKDLYHMRGIYRILYPPAYFIYNLVFKKYALKRLPALRELYPLQKTETILELCYLKNISHALIVIIGANVAALLLLLGQNGQKILVDGIYVTRNNQGEGSKNVELTVEFENGREDVSVVVGEKRLDEAGVIELEKICEDYIQKNILGENISLEHITDKLNFFSEIPGYSVGVQWESSDYLIIGMDGTIKNEEIKEAVPVKLTAVCTYFDKTWEYNFDVIVEPEVKDKNIQRKEAITEALADQESKTAGEDSLVLPDYINGEQVVWSEKGENSSGIILILGGIAVVLIFAREKESCAKAQKCRTAQLISDYPVFVHKVVLLLGAGMTSKAAWFRMISDYNRNLKKGGKQRYVYEEMLVAANEMKQGIAEITAYENFGRRCGTSQYLKFSSILIQSVKTGARGMGRMLTDAGDEAVILRRENAKRIGEEAGTKLLFPMVVLLGVMMFIIIIPAFMSMNF